MAGNADGRYRPCVGLAVFNHQGRVFIGRRRFSSDLGELEHVWQMPQGGIDPDEAPLAAAERELYEETNMRSVALLGESGRWLTYDIPASLVGVAWRGRYRGQRQKWFAFRFDGDESEIDVERPGGGGHKPEFEAWRWERLERVPELVVPFKRAVYKEVVAEFSRFATATHSAGASAGQHRLGS
jgi:putative (di)nucleoside polyphosphate hydrolase